MKKLTFIIWNINKKKDEIILSAIEELILEKKPDFLLLIETYIDDDTIHNISKQQLKSVMLKQNKTVRLYINPQINTNILNEIVAEDGQRRHIKYRIVFFKLETKNENILLVGVHFPSKFNYNEKTQFNIMKRWRRWIEEQEKLLDTNKTIIFGDLNLNPFDYAIYRDGGLNAFPTITTETKIKPLYYNPMWSTLGDFIYKTNTLKIPGSFFWDVDEDNAEDYHWNSIDGVLIKNNLVDNFLKEELEIITEIPNHKFAHNQEINSKYYSDHLPVKFKIQI